MHTYLHTLILQALAGLAAGAALSIPAAKLGPVFTVTSRDASPEPEPESDHSAAVLTTRTNTAAKIAYNGSAHPADVYYCGEVAMVETAFGPDTPLAADCDVIARRYPESVKGYWTITPQDQAAAPGGWVTLDTYKTCAFKVWLDLSATTLTTYRFGSEDVRYYATVYLRDQQGGHYQGTSPVMCAWNTVKYFVHWGIVSPSFAGL